MPRAPQVFHGRQVDESTLEGDVRQVTGTTTPEGFTSITVETVAVGPQPWDRQLVLMLWKPEFGSRIGHHVNESVPTLTMRSESWMRPSYIHTSTANLPVQCGHDKPTTRTQRI